MSDYQYIVRTENLCKSFGSLEVLRDVNLSVKKGEVICIIGPSGAGKSTYLRSLKWAWSSSGSTSSRTRPCWRTS